MGPPPPDVSPYGTNRLNGSPHISAPTPPPASSARTPTETPPLRHPTTSYDTRPPPPPPPSGFAAVNNPPPQPGFAAVNSKPNSTPPMTHAAPATEQRHKQHAKSADQTPARASADDEKTPAGSSSTNKRTPSTTHPYQMSEAFANRHHHCERTDSLNRGIWTWYGPGGTQDRPTAPATEMYLVCNHDGCRRIDWRTVHGLQCHIVKNHEIPKGTIGSLEKALAAYGVPIGEIEEIERRNGVGSGGTMADPKNLKIKSRLRESGGTPLSAQKQYRPNNSDSPNSFSAPQKSDTGNQLSTQHELVPNPRPESTPTDVGKEPEYRPSGGFAAVNTAWQGVNTTPSKETASHDGDVRARPASESKPVSHAVREAEANGTPAPFWSSWQATNAPSTTKEWTKPEKAESMQHSMLPDAGPTSNSNAVPASASASFVGHEPEAIQSRTQRPLVEVDGIGGRVEPKDSTSETLLEDTKAIESESNVVDTHMGSAAEIQEPQAQPESFPTAARPEQPRPAQVGGDGEENKDTPIEKTQVDKEEPKTIKQDAIPFMQSPEVSHRTRPSRRESRRTSVATAISAKTGPDKAKEEEIETSSTTHTASKAGSAIDDDGDSITVNVTALKAERERKDEDDSTRTPTRRLPNGRFTRRTR